MLAPTNLEVKLSRFRDKRLDGQKIIDKNRDPLALDFTQKRPKKERLNKLDIRLLDPKCLYHINDIKNLCVTYRLRFLDVRYFKNELPTGAKVAIKDLEAKHDISLDSLKIMAPSKMFALQNADDPLLFAPVYGGYYYLVHKWGNDLHPLRKWLVWPFKSFENLIFTVLLVSLLVTWMLPMELFSKTQSSISESFMLFLFTFKAVGAIVLYYGFAKGKNFNSAIWNSKYYNA